jgi:hypothetical protein
MNGVFCEQVVWVVDVSYIATLSFFVWPWLLTAWPVNKPYMVMYLHT